MQASSGILLDEDEFRRIRRYGRYLVAELLKPHDVLSTCRVNGGLRSDLDWLVNHQSCEPAGHAARAYAIIDMGQTAYHGQVCDELGLEKARTACMGTAANMQYAAVQEEAYEEFRILAVVTAGVEGNAGCAGDPATWVERNQSYEKAAPAGTINTMLFFNVPLSAAALARAVVTMTEAKTAALNELAVRSNYSTERATGTGTDQYCVAAPSGEPQITWTGKHSKIGELIGVGVRAATREALRWQNGLEASRARDIHRALGRRGFTPDFFKERLRTELADNEFVFIRKNLVSITHEPQFAAHAFMLAELCDRIDYGTIPAATGREQILNQAALAAACLAAAPERFSELRRRLQAYEDEEVREIFFRAFLLGWREKWSS